MANVLGEMFKDQANGIGTFPPASFASKIREINKLIGTGGGGSTPVSNRGSFTTPSSDAVVTVTHGLNVRPDILYVWTSKTLTENKYLLFAFITSKAFHEATGINMSNITIEKEGWSMSGGQTHDGYESRNEYVHDQYGLIFGSDETTFQIGCANPVMNQLSPNTQYEFVAIGGLT